MSADTRYTEESLNGLPLWPDFLTFTDEAIVPQHKTGPYSYTPLGLPDSYKDSAEKHGPNFENYQVVKKKNRAEIETETWHRLNQWQNTAKHNLVPVGSHFIWFSPRGSVEEGYIGTQPTNPHLVSVYTKTNFGIEMVQFKTWSSLEQLAFAIRKLGYAITGRYDNPAHNLIAASGPCIAPITLAKVEEILFDTQYDTLEPWPVLQEHLPIIDLVAFSRFRREVFTAYQIMVYKYCLLINDGHKSKHKEYKRSIQFLDACFTIICKSLKGWVYYHDQRPNKGNSYRSELTTSVDYDISSTITPFDIQSLVSDKNVKQSLLDLLDQVEKVIVKKVKLTKTESDYVGKLSDALMLNAPQLAFSLGQCVGLAPISFLSSNLVKFKGGFLPKAIAEQEGWLQRTGICARLDACVSPLKGQIQNLGPCDWCFDCDGRFGYLRELGNISHQLFRPKKTTPLVPNALSLVEKSSFPPQNSLYTLFPEQSVSLTKLLAGQVEAA